MTVVDMLSKEQCERRARLRTKIVDAWKSLEVPSPSVLWSSVPDDTRDIQLFLGRRYDELALDTNDFEYDETFWCLSMEAKKYYTAGFMIRCLVIADNANEEPYGWMDQSVVVALKMVTRQLKYEDLSEAESGVIKEFCQVIRDYGEFFHEFPYPRWQVH